MILVRLSISFTGRDRYCIQHCFIVAFLYLYWVSALNCTALQVPITLYVNDLKDFNCFISKHYILVLDIISS